MLDNRLQFINLRWQTEGIDKETCPISPLISMRRRQRKIGQPFSKQCNFNQPDLHLYRTYSRI